MSIGILSAGKRLFYPVIGHEPFYITVGRKTVGKKMMTGKNAGIIDNKSKWSDSWHNVILVWRCGLDRAVRQPIVLGPSPTISLFTII